MNKTLKKAPLVWKSHVRNLFDEILVNKDCWILENPLKITMRIMGAAADEAAKQGNEKMIGFFCMMALYTFSDPTHADFDQERTNYYINKAIKP